MEVTLKQAGELIEKANKIVLSSHVNPDGDNVGSTLGLYHALKGTNKDIKILLDDDLPDNLGMMEGLDLYQKPQDGEIIECDLLVILDVDVDRIGRVKDVVKAPILNLDHHISNTKVSDYCYVDAKAAATAQIVYSLIKEMNWQFNLEAATCIYTGLCSDTGFFCYSNTTPYTLKAAAELLEIGVKPDKISEIFYQRSFSSVKAAGRAIDTIELYHDGKIALMIIDKALKESADNTEGFVNFARNIRGVDVAVMIKYADDEVTRVSMRSKSVNVSEIAQSIGGGGHIRAAGATVYKNLMEAKDIKAYFKNGEMHQVDVIGSVRVVYYPMESDSTLIGMNVSETSLLNIYLENRKMKKMVMSPKSNGTLYPMLQLPPDKMKLENFNWFDYIRLLNKEDIFNWRGKKAGQELKKSNRGAAPLPNQDLFNKKKK